VNEKHLRNFTFRVRWSEEDGKWLGQCPAFMNLAAYGTDHFEAFTKIVKLVNDHVEATGETPTEGSVFKNMDDMLSGAPGPFGRLG
jgi:hypothetical protein